MAATIKKVVLWRRDLDNRPGALAKTLKPLVEAGNNLSIVMGYAYPNNHKKAAVEVYPIQPKAVKAAKQAGLSPAKKTACISVEANDRLGLGEAICEALAENNINMTFLVVQTIGKKWMGVFGFDNEKIANKAQPIIKKACSAKATSKKSASKARKR